MAISACVSNYSLILHPPAGSLTEATMGGGGILRYVVPAYQRPYQWKQQPFSRFVGERGLADHLITNGAATPFFAGHVVFYRDPVSAIAEVVDGQQRFTSLAIITAALRDECLRDSQYELAWVIHENLISDNGNFFFSSSAYNSDDQDMMRIIQEIPSNDRRPGGDIGCYRSEPLDLSFEITLDQDLPAGRPFTPTITTSSGGFNFPIPAGTQLDFNGTLATLVSDHPAMNGGPFALQLQSATIIPIGAVATATLNLAGISTDAEFDTALGAALIPPQPNRYQQLDRRKRWWRYYKIAKDEIRATVGMGITFLNWNTLLDDNLVLTIARSDLNREAQNYFKVINDDRFRQPLTLADVWRAELISAVTTDAEVEINIIQVAPNADPFGIDGGRRAGFITGMGGLIDSLSEAIRTRLFVEGKNDEYGNVNNFIEHFCISYGKRTSGTATLEEFEIFRQYLFEQLKAARPPGALTSGVPGVALPESPINADIRLHWLAYRELMLQIEERSQVYREIVLAEIGDPYGTRLKNLHRTSHKQYIPLLLVGLSKIRRSASLAGVPRPLPGAAAAIVAAWVPYGDAEDRILRMIEYLLVRGTILPAPNDGAITPNVIYTQLVKWCAALDQCADNIVDIDNTLQLISGSAASPAAPPRPAGLGGMPAARAAIPALGPPPVVQNFVIDRKYRWERTPGGGAALVEPIYFDTIYGLCAGRTWENPAIPGSVDPVFWTDPEFVYPNASESRLMLWRIEAHLRDLIAGAVAGNLDLTLTNDSDVEHILPKTLTPYWNMALGAASHEDWLDRLGNKGLYASVSNIAISNNDFPDKQTNAPHGYNNTTGQWYHMHDLTNPKTASPLLPPGYPNEAPHNTPAAPPGVGIYGGNWTPTEIEIRGEWLFGILWDIFDPLP